METKALNYRIVIEKEKQNKGYLYVAYAPSLGISDFGKTIEDATSNIEKAIKLYLGTLLDLKKPIPAADSEEYFVTSKKIEVSIPSKNLAF